MTMIEKMARAILASYNDNCSDGPMEWDEAVELAKAALEALREPSEGMLMGGTAALDPIKGQTAFPTDEEATVVWQAMIDAALGEQP